MRSLISILDFSVEELDNLIATAKDIIAHPENYREKCRYKKLATLFFEPSTLILIGVGGYQMSQDSGKGKMTVAAGVLIPVFLAVVYYIFKTVLKIDLDFSPNL